MKLLIAILFALPLLSQVPTPTTNVQTDPGGSCPRNANMQYNVRTGQYWGCQGNATLNWQNGVWAKISPANVITTTTANPMGAACDAKTLVLRTPGGALYTCANGIYAPAGGSATPGGATTNVQFNNAGSLGGSDQFTFDGLSIHIGPDESTLPAPIHRSDSSPLFITSLGDSAVRVESAGNNVQAITAVNSVTGEFGTAIEGDISLGVTGVSGFGVSAYGQVEAGIAATSFTGLHAWNPFLDSGASLINLYGLLIEDQSGATNNWAIKTGLGKVEFGDQVNAPSVTTNALTVATLPASPVAGQRAFVTDSNAASFTAGIGAIVASGGSTKVPVFYDGANWRIG